MLMSVGSRQDKFSLLTLSIIHGPSTGILLFLLLMKHCLTYLVHILKLFHPVAFGIAMLILIFGFILFHLQGMLGNMPEFDSLWLSTFLKSNSLGRNLPIV
jgi:hypothetical protein